MSAGKALLEKDPAAVPNLGNERGPEINRRREKERDQEVRREDLRLEAQTVGDATGIGDGRYAGRMANQRTVDQNVANQNEEARRSQAWRSTRKRKREFERGRDEKENARLAALLDLGEEQEVPELDDPMEIAPSNSDHSVENYLEELLAQNLEEGLDLHIRNGSGSSSELPTSQSESPEFQEDSGAGSQTRVARSDSRDQVADVQGPKSMAAPITVFSTNRNGVFAPQEFLLKKYEGALGFFSKARDETGVFFKGCGRLLKFATSPAMRAQYKTLVGIGWEALKEWAQGVDWGDLAKRGLIAGIKLQNWVMKAPFIALREIVKFGINLLTDWPECWRKIKIVGGAIKTAALAVKGFSDSIGLSQVLEGLYHLATFQIEAIIRGGMFVFQTAKNFSLLLTRQLSLKDFNNVQAHAGKKHLAALYNKVQKGTSTLGVGLKLLADVTGLLSAWGFLKHTALGIHEFGKPDGIRDDRKGAKDLIFGAAYLADAAIAIPTTVAAVTAAVGTGGLASWLSGCLMTLRVSWKMAAREVFYQARDYIGKKAAYRLAGRLSEREVAGAATEVMKDSVIELTKSALKKGGKVESSTLRALLEKHAERTMGQVYDRVDIQGICADITKEFLQEADKKSKNELVAMLLEMGITDPKRASELAHRTKWVVRSGRYSTQLQADIVHGIMRHVTQYMEAGLETECRNGMAMLLRGGRARAGGLSDLTNKALLKSADLAHASEVISGFLARESGGNTAKLFARDRARSAEIGRELASEFCELIESMVKKSESATRTFTEMAQAHKEEILEIEEAIRRLQLVPQREAEVMAQALHRAVRKGVPIRGETGISSGGGSLEDLMRGSFTNRINKMFRSDGAQQELAEECAKRALHGNTGEPVETIAERYARRYGDEIVEAHEKLIDDYIDEGWQGMRRGNRRALEPRVRAGVKAGWKAFRNQLRPRLFPFRHRAEKDVDEEMGTLTDIVSIDGIEIFHEVPQFYDIILMIQILLERCACSKYPQRVVLYGMIQIRGDDRLWHTVDQEVIERNLTREQFEDIFGGYRKHAAELSIAA